MHSAWTPKLVLHPSREHSLRIPSNLNLLSFPSKIPPFYEELRCTGAKAKEQILNNKHRQDNMFLDTLSP